ncbi:centromere protein F [Hoplias malabaricus]|uniref:centromere protein F n=1 Tax=Hoplias malabaricus TaxID=27720 RepID=UPI00346258E7
MMSWATEDWTAGLSGRVLQKVQELQAHNEKLTREKQQRQLQLDNSETALHKQKQKYEEVRVELAAVHRDLVGVRDGAQAEARAKERLIQELQTKAAQVCALENQLESAKSITQKLTHEVKRLEAELEKLQKESVSGESMMFSTPCWNMNSPWDQNGGKSVLRGEGDHVRQQLLFGDSPKPLEGGVSSQLPQQPYKTPSLRRGVLQSEGRTHSSLFPWERDDTRPVPRGRPASTPFSSSSSDGLNSRDNGTEESLRKERDDLCMKVSGLQKELQVEKERLRETESRLSQIQKDVDMKGQNLARSKDELARAQTRIAQEGDRAQAAEQRVKHLQEELKCQRQNAETSRCNAELRRKDMERDHQKELLELQRERQSMEKQHQQENNRLNQEIQQARTAHNTLQAQHDKLSLQKQAVERDLEEVQAKLKSAQSDLTDSQKKETQTQAKLTESLRESEALRVNLEQLKKKEKSLEAEVKNLTEELAEALKLIKELQAQLSAPPPPLVSHSFTPVTEDNFPPVLSVHPDRTPPHQYSSQRKRPPKPGRQRDTGRPETLPYPPDREPAEGIESEHISEFGSEDSVTVSTKGHKGNQHRAERPGEIDIESSITEQDTGIEDTDTDSYMSDSMSERLFKDEGFLQTDIRCDSGNKNSTSVHQGQKQDLSSLKELTKENAVLREELRDVKKELDKRMDDLETQRRAEAEARTKLKQLSKKHSSQTEQHRAKAQELKEKGSKLETLLEQEKKESAELRVVVAALEKEAEKRQEEEEIGEMERKEEIVKLKEDLAETEEKVKQLEGERENIQKELTMLQSELFQEREERARQSEEEKKLLKSREHEGLKMAELQAELGRLQLSAALENRNIKDNLPLTYLQLGNQSKTTDVENNVTSSATNNVSFCESANLQNTTLSKETTITSLINVDTCNKSVEILQKSTGDSTSTKNVGSQEKPKECTDLDDTTVLVLELERVRIQRDKEAEKAKKAQKKLDILQNQVTSQTQQLTLAFEKQSKHIDDLLRELQERDNALFRQGEELQSCQKEIASLKADKQKRELVKSSTEQAAEAFENSDCVLVTSSVIADAQSMVKEESLNMKNKPLQLDSQFSANVDDGNCHPRSRTCELPINSKEAVSLFTSDEHGWDSSFNAENTKMKGPLQPITPAQEGSNDMVQSNSEKSESFTFSSPSKSMEQSDISEFPHSLMEYPTDDVSGLKMAINDLHGTQNELLKVKHNQLTVQLQEVSKEEFLTLKQENEQLKSKWKEIENETQASQNSLLTQHGSFHLTNTKVENRATGEPIDSDSPWLKEAVAVCESSENGERDSKEEGEMINGKSEDETQVHFLQKQVQALEAKLQLLSAHNREQAEELQIWRLSASSTGECVEDLSSGSPRFLVREDQLVFSCSPTGRQTLSQQSSFRSVGEHGDLSQTKGYFDPEAGHDERDNQLLSQKTLRSFQSVLRAKELITDDGSTATEANIQQKEITSPDVESTALLSSSQMVGIKDDFSHQNKEREDALENVSISSEAQPKENTFAKEILEDCTAIFKSEYTIPDTKFVTEQAEMRDPQKSNLHHGDTVIHNQNFGKVTEQAAAPGRQTENSAQNGVVMKCLATGESQKSGTALVTGTADQPSTKEMKTMSTQTEKCSPSDVVDVGKHITPQRTVVLLHASTQTQAEEVKQPKEEDEESIDSPPTSPAPPTDPEKLLFSGAFPIPANPAHLAERIRRNRSRMSAAYDDTEYEPYGLPEVVMKGFADIPSGLACPYVLRRGLLGTDALPVSLREPLKKVEEDIEP